MKNEQDPRLKILVIIGSVLIGLMVILIVINLASGSKNPEGNSNGSPEISVNKTRYEFGTIKMSEGKAKHTFEFTNTGDGDLKISSLDTSCMCTRVTLIVDGKRSPDFGMKGMGGSPAFWSDVLAPGQKAELEVIFDPLFHGPDATGPISRTITMVTNNEGQNRSQQLFYVTGDVVK